MSPALSDEIVIEGQSLKITKRLDRERFKHLGVIYEIHSARDDPVQLRLIDTVPPSIPVGFHPQYGGSDWSMGDRTVVFERELEPGEELVTLYGLGTGAIDSVEQFRTEPTVEFKRSDATSYERLGSAVDESARAGEGGTDSGVASTSITELAEALEAEGEDGESDAPTAVATEANRPNRNEIRPEQIQLRTALQESIDQLETITGQLSERHADEGPSGLERGAARFHVQSILFHLAHLREDLSLGNYASETGSSEGAASSAPDPGESADHEPAESDSMTAAPDRTAGLRTVRARLEETLVGVPRPGQGLPLFWLVALIGLVVFIVGFGLLGNRGLDLYLTGLGGFVAVISTVGWVVAEDKLPLPMLPLAVTLAGIALLAHPFLLGTPRSVAGLLTLAAGVLIATIPMVVENRRWQLLGLLET